MFGVLLFCEIMICLFSTVHLITKCSKKPKSSLSAASSSVDHSPEGASVAPATPPAAAEIVKSAESEDKPKPAVDLKPRNTNGPEKSINSAFNEGTAQQDGEMPSQHV